MAGKEKPIRIVIADDQHLVRQGFRAMLERLPSMEVVAEASTGGEAIEQYARHRPDVLLLDLRFPDMCGVEAIRAIREQFLIARIVVLTTYDGDEDIYQALRAGATSYLCKDMLVQDLVPIVREVHNGGRPIPPSVASRMAERISGSQLRMQRSLLTGVQANGGRQAWHAVTRWGRRRSRPFSSGPCSTCHGHLAL